MKNILLIFVFLIGVNANSQSSKIDSTEIIQIGGIKQVISIKGNDRQNPILLFLHGGPGASLMESSEKFTDKLKEEFVVVNWDQRETGKTLAINKSDKKLTPELYKNDANEVVKYLLKHFGREKLYLVSHSWGSVLGFNIAKNNPQSLYAYIPISPIINRVKESKLTEQDLRRWAKKTNNQQALKELALVKIPYQNPDDLFYSQKWTFIHNGADFALKEDFKPTYYKWLNVWFEMWKDSVKDNLFRSLPEIKCPIFFIEGNVDGFRVHNVVNDYYHFVKAPKKDFFWMEKSGHTVFNSEPDKLQSVIIGIKKTLNN